MWEEGREVLDTSGYGVVVSGPESGMRTKGCRMGNGRLKAGGMVNGRKTIRGRRKECKVLCEIGRIGHHGSGGLRKAGE